MSNVRQVCQSVSVMTCFVSRTTMTNHNVWSSSHGGTQTTVQNTDTKKGKVHSALKIGV